MGESVVPTVAEPSVLASFKVPRKPLDLARDGELGVDLLRVGEVGNPCELKRVLTGLCRCTRSRAGDSFKECAEKRQVQAHAAE